MCGSVFCSLLPSGDSFPDSVGSWKAWRIYLLCRWFTEKCHRLRPRILSSILQCHQPNRCHHCLFFHLPFSPSITFIFWDWLVPVNGLVGFCLLQGFLRVPLNSVVLWQISPQQETYIVWSSALKLKLDFGKSVLTPGLRILSRSQVSGVWPLENLCLLLYLHQDSSCIDLIHLCSHQGKVQWTSFIT